MKESETEYTLIDSDGDKTKVVFIHRHCGCFLPGCVDDELRIYLDGDDDSPSCVTLPRMMTPYIEGLFKGELKVGESW